MQTQQSKSLFYKAGSRILIGVFIGATLILVIYLLFSATDSVPNKNEPEKGNSAKNYTVRPPEIPDTVYFAGERVPIENFDVRESLDREMLSVAYFHSSTMLNMKRANRVFPVIEQILNENGIPEDFKYMAVAESNLVNAVSYAGARGVWQFMTSTAKGYGLEVSKEVDERYHLEKSTQAACDYLKRSYKKYKDWPLVAAAYNYGQGNIDRQLERQKEDSYYNLYLNPETARYYYRIIAIKLIFENPEKYGFDIKKEDLFPPVATHTIEVDSSIVDLADFAQSQGTNYKMLKTFNPWLRQNYLQNHAGKTYKIKIPEVGSRQAY